MDKTFKEKIEDLEEHVPDYYTFPLVDPTPEDIEEVKEWVDFKEM